MNNNHSHVTTIVTASITAGCNSLLSGDSQNTLEKENTEAKSDCSANTAVVTSMIATIHKQKTDTTSVNINGIKLRIMTLPNGAEGFGFGLISS